jgi:TolB-like protein
VDSGAAGAEEGFWVAVLPFRHRGSDPGLVALAEGMSEEIVTGLERFSYLRVISRSSTERYASETADVRSVGQELGARYVLEGSLRQAGAQLRVAAQLVDARTGAHLWAETYNRPFRPDEIFELQDDLVPRIVSTVADWYGGAHTPWRARKETPIVHRYLAFFAPGAATQRIPAASPGISRDEANGSAWLEGRRLLGRALAEDIEVFVWHAGLASPELHVARVAARVRKGGHAVPEARVRERYDRGRLNLVRLLPKLTELRLFDNSEEADPDAGREPHPKLLLHMRRGRIVSVCALPEAPEWAKPILAAAFLAGG